MLLTTALIASVVSNYLMRSECESLLSRNSAMAAELQIFDIVDKDKVHSVELAQPFKMAWQFRIYVPPGKKMQFNYGIGQVEEGLFPKPMRSFEEMIEGSKKLQTLAVQFRRAEGEFTTINAFVNGRFAHGVSARAGNTYDWLHQFEEYSPASTMTQLKVSPCEENVVLLDLSEDELSNFPLGNRKIPDPPNRFIIWLEPVE